MSVVANKSTKLTHLNKKIQIDEPLCKIESLHNHYSRSNIHDTTNAFKDMELKFWCFRHTRLDIKDIMICEMHLHVAIG